MQGFKFWLKIGLFLSIPLILMGVSYITQKGLPQQLLSSLTSIIAPLSKPTPYVQGTTKSISPSTQNNTSPEINKVPVYLTSQKYTIDCPSQNVDAVKSIDAIMSSKGQEWAKEYNDCVVTFESNDSCYASCRSTLKRNGDRCIQNIEEWSTKEYDECKEVASLLYGECVKPCLLSYIACDWVYTEQKILLSQINKLCE